MNFINIWNRIQASTGIKNLNELSEIVGTSQPTVSRTKKEGQFPVDWAYKIGRKYNLLTEWIMTGTGPMRIGEEVSGEGTTDINTISLTEHRKQKRRHADDLPITINEQLIPINEWLEQLPIIDRLEFLHEFRGRFAAFEIFWQKKIRREEDGKNIAVGDDTTS